MQPNPGDAAAPGAASQGGFAGILALPAMQAWVTQRRFLGRVHETAQHDHDVQVCAVAVAAGALIRGLLGDHHLGKNVASGGGCHALISVDDKIVRPLPLKAVAAGFTSVKPVVELSSTAGSIVHSRRRQHRWNVAMHTSSLLPSADACRL